MAGRVSRRTLLAAGAAFAAMAGRAGAERPARTLTPEQPAGPFFPARLPLDRDSDLVGTGAEGQRAQGTVIHVTGRVLDRDGRPLAGARVEIWQANSFGRYAHPRDRSDRPLDPNFQGYGRAEADGAGAYRFRTIKPGAYGNWLFTRTPHIHFLVTARDGGGLTTQMYFAGEALNDSDGLLDAISDPAQRAAVTVPFGPAMGIEDGALMGRFDIVVG